MKRNTTIKLATSIATVFTLQAGIYANIVAVSLSWSGDNGYTMQGTMSYEEGSNTVSNGVGIQDMSVSFFDDSSSLLGTFAQVSSGTVTYNFLTFTYNKGTQDFSGSFDFGEDTSSLGDYYLYGTIGSSATLRDVFSNSTLDTSSTTSIATTAIPEPAAIGLMALIGGGLMAIRRIFII